MTTELTSVITVAELIEALNRFPGDAEVLLGGDICRHGHVGVEIGNTYYGVANTLDGIIRQNNSPNNERRTL